MTYKSGQFCHAEAHWIIREKKNAVEVKFLDFHIFLTHPTVLAVFGVDFPFDGMDFCKFSGNFKLPP